MHVHVYPLPDLTTSTLMGICRITITDACTCLSTDQPVRLKLWDLEDGQSSRWIEHSITLPEELVRCNSESWCSFSYLPTGEMLLAKS